MQPRKHEDAEGCIRCFHRALIARARPAAPATSSGAATARRSFLRIIFALAGGVTVVRSVRLPPSLKLRRTAVALAEAVSQTPDRQGPPERGHHVPVSPPWTEPAPAATTGAFR